MKNISGGELQRVALILALGKSADIYLIDEPSAYLDSEQRLTAAKVRYSLRYLDSCASGVREVSFHDSSRLKLLARGTSRRRSLASPFAGETVVGNLHRFRFLFVNVYELMG